MSCQIIIMYRLYDFLPSGNGYKIRLLLTQLQIPFELIELNILLILGSKELNLNPDIF